MQKIRKIYRADFRENRGRQTERQTDRQTDRDGPEYKGPPDAIAKPSDQKQKICCLPGCGIADNCRTVSTVKKIFNLSFETIVKTTHKTAFRYSLTFAIADTYKEHCVVSAIRR